VLIVHPIRMFFSNLNREFNMNIYTIDADQEYYLAEALNASKSLDQIFTDGLDIHLEKSAYTTFDYNLEMDAIDIKRRRAIQSIHEISDMLMDRFAMNLPEDITNQLICMDTTHKWYGKCECCGAEITDGLHPVGHAPYHHGHYNAMMN